MLFFCFSFLHGTNPPQEVFDQEQVAVLTCVCERHGSSSSFFAHDVPQEIGAFRQYALRIRVDCFDVFQPMLPNYFNRFSRPNWHTLWENGEIKDRNNKNSKSHLQLRT